jgi:methyl-accepting chemotaxis protein
MNQAQAKPSYRRTNVYIDKEFQMKFILKFCGVVAAGAGVTILLLYLLSQQSTSVSFVQARVKVMTTADFILPLLIQTVLIVMAVVGVASIGVTLIVSHKIAGPLFRFKQTFKELSSGNFTNQVRLRKGDQLLEVAGDFNHMISIVREKLLQANTQLAGIKADIDAIGEFNIDDAKRKRFHELQFKVQELEKAMKFFKL